MSLAGLNRVVDYPARDLTVTVEAGITLAKLDAPLAAEGQWLPIEVPQRRLGQRSEVWWPRPGAGRGAYGWGQVRDYVIGISAVDGRGLPFKGGVGSSKMSPVTIFANSSPARWGPWA